MKSTGGVQVGMLNFLCRTASAVADAAPTIVTAGWRRAGMALDARLGESNGALVGPTAVAALGHQPSASIGPVGSPASCSARRLRTQRWMAPEARWIYTDC